MDTHELAWAAGFYDGEGSISGMHEKATRRPRTAVCISQIEPTTLQRMQRAFGFGKMYGPYHRNPPQHDVYTFVIRDFEHAQAAIAMMWRWLSEPKRKQAAAVFAQVKQYLAARDSDRDGRLEVCHYGHKKDPNAPILVGKRYGRSRKCRQCSLRSERRWRAEHSTYFTSETRKERRRQLYAAKKAVTNG